MSVVSASQILSRFGRVLDPKAEPRQRARKEISSDEEINVFFSHVWGSHPKARWMGILWHVNWTRAVGAAIFATAISAAIMSFYVDGRDWTRFEQNLGLTARSVLALIGTLVLVISFFLVEKIIPINKKCFLDRCCIDQESTESKTAGIKRIPDMLAQSQALVVLLSEDYFQRLWCIYEIALYRSNTMENPTKKREIVFVPLRIIFLAVFLTLVDLVATVLFQSNIRSLISSDETNDFVWVSVAFSITTGALIYSFSFLWHEGLLRYRKQLSSFSLDNVQCTDESDRVVLIADIEERFNGRNNFEKYVQTEVLGQIAERPRIKFLIWICLPSLLSVLGYINVITQRMGLYCFQAIHSSSKVVKRDDSFCSILDRSTTENVVIIVVESLAILLYYPVLVSLTLMYVQQVSRVRLALRYGPHFLGLLMITGVTYAHSLQFGNQLLASGIQLGFLSFLGLVIWGGRNFSRWFANAKSESSLKYEKLD